MNEDEYALSKEIRGYESDKKMTERAVSAAQNKWKELLNGEMGKDIKDVMSGKKKVKLTLKENISYRWRNIKERLKLKKGK